MSILSWNCRGLGNSSAVPSLRDLVRTYQPNVIFLCETLIHANKIEEIRRRLGFDFSFVVDRVGRSGELALLRKQPFDCHILSYATNFINAEMSYTGQPSWQFTGYYGFLESERRRDSWNLLRTLAQDNSLLWCTMGDYNDILSNEHKRGPPHPLLLIRGFRETIQACNLNDLPMEGYKFTWIKSRNSLDSTEERLDRALATQDWLDVFPHFRFQNTIADKSDHSPILLRLFERERHEGVRVFKFENSLLKESELDDVVL